MKSFMTILSVLIISPSIFALPNSLFSNTPALIEELKKDGDCQRMLDVALSREADATRFSLLGEKDEKGKGHQLIVISNRAYEQRNAVRELLVQTCFK